MQMTEDEIQAQYALQSPEWPDIQGGEFPKFYPYLDGWAWRMVRIEADGERYLHQAITGQKDAVEALIANQFEFDIDPTTPNQVAWKKYFPVMESPAAERRDYEMYLSELDYDRRKEEADAAAELAEQQQYDDQIDRYYGYEGDY